MKQLGQMRRQKLNRGGVGETPSTYAVEYFKPYNRAQNQGQQLVNNNGKAWR